MDFFALIIMLVPAFVTGFLFLAFRKKVKSIAYLFLALSISLLLSVLIMWIPEVSGKQLSKRFEEIQFFQRNMPPIPKANTPDWEYWVLAQSNLVQALYTYADKHPKKDSIANIMVSHITHKMMDEEQFPLQNYPKRWSSQALFLSHINIILATYQAMTNDDQYAGLHKKISNFLSAKMISSPFKNVYTAGKEQGYYPAENAVILESLRLSDQVQHSNYLKRTLQDWERFIKRELLYDNSKLPCTNFSESDKCKLLPQSTYLNWMVIYLNKADPDFAREIWHQTKFYYKESTLTLWKSFKRYHPDDTPPAYAKNNPRPLEVISPNVLAKLTAATRQNRLIYFQINNLFLLKKFFNGKTVVTQDNYWRQALNSVLHFRAECQ